MKKPIVLFLISILPPLLLTACNHTAPPGYPFMKANNENTILVADRLENTLFSYDTNSCSVIEKMNANYSVYADNPLYNYGAIGHNTQNNYSIISLTDHEATIELRLPADEAIVPLAFSKDYLFFMRARAGTSGINVVRYDPASHKLINYTHLTEPMKSAAICGHTLYYTVLNEEHAYSLFKTDCDDPDALPEMVRYVIGRSEIYAQGNDLYLTDNKFLFCDFKRFEKGLLNYFIGEKYLLQYVDNIDSIDAVIIDTETGETLKRAANILGVTANDQEIIMYCQNSLERFQYQ